MPRVMTVRLDDHLAQDLEVVARLTGRAVTAVVRTAIEEYVAEQRLEPDFLAAAERVTSENRGRLARFGRHPV